MAGGGVAGSGGADTGVDNGGGTGPGGTVREHAPTAMTAMTAAAAEATTDRWRNKVSTLTTDKCQHSQHKTHDA